MITSQEPWRSGRIIRRTLLASLVLHVLIMAAVIDLAGSRIVDALRHTKTHQPEIVTISSAITIAKRPKPVPVPRPAERHQQIPRSSSEPPVAAFPEPRLHVPLPPAAMKAPHELAKSVEHASPQPPRPVQHPAVSAADEPERKPQPARHAPRQLALAAPPARGGEGRISQERLAKIEADLAKTIAQARRQEDPLRAVPKETPAAPKHYAIQMEGALGALSHGEGWYYPISSWRADGWDWYYVSYEMTYPDGTLERGNVPWPIRFPPRGDPFAHPEIVALHHTPLPPPLPGFQLTPQQAATLGKALRSYFSNTGFAQTNQ